MVLWYLSKIKKTHYCLNFSNQNDPMIIQLGDICTEKNARFDFVIYI